MPVHKVINFWSYISDFQKKPFCLFLFLDGYFGSFYGALGFFLSDFFFFKDDEFYFSPEETPPYMTRYFKLSLRLLLSLQVFAKQNYSNSA